MNLLEIREQVVKISGRYDLVTDPIDFEDKGIDFFINAGQNMLDRLGIIKNSVITLSMPLAIGEYSITFTQRYMNIQEVWANNTEERLQLTKVTLKELKEYYADLVSEIDAGAPAFYALATVKTLEAADRDDLGVFLNLEVPETDPGYAYKGIIVAPPVDEAYIIDIVGTFYQEELSTNTQETYWTVYAPETLVKASLYQLYTFSGRTKEAENIKGSLFEDTMLLDMTGVEEDIAELGDMGD